MPKTQANLSLRVFDVVEFQRRNEHTRPPRWEEFKAVWMYDDNGNVFVYFGRADTKFCQSVAIGSLETIGVTVREVYPKQDHDNPPKGWDHLPERNVVIRPQIGGYESLRIAERRAERKAARIAKLRG